MGTINIRRAIENDVDFVIETIIEAEKSLTDKLSYSTIFNLSIEEVQNTLKRICLLDFQGQELCFSQYLIIEAEGQIAGACCAWIEAEDGLESSLIKGNLLLSEFGREKIIEARKYFPLLHQITIEREPGTLQIVNAYVKSEFRGQGLIGKLILEHIRIYKEKHPTLKKVQLRPIKSNPQACRAYEKIGFRIVLEKTVNDKSVLEILPADTKVLMEKIL